MLRFPDDGRLAAQLGTTTILSSERARSGRVPFPVSLSPETGTPREIPTFPRLSSTVIGRVRASAALVRVRGVRAFVETAAPPEFA